MNLKPSLKKEDYSDLINSLQLEEHQKRVLQSVWFDYLILMDKSARKGWIRHNYSQILIMCFGLLIPIIEKSKLNFNIFELDISVISVFGLIIAGLTALNRQIGFEEKWRHYRRAAETVRNEGFDYFALAGNYVNYTNHSDAFKNFIQVITSYKRQEVDVYLEEQKKDKKE